jgi:hypothetical protein
MLPGFSKNLLAAVKALEGTLSNFKERIKGIERDLKKEYQTLENSLESRTKRIEHLETVIRSGIVSPGSGAGQIASLQAKNRILQSDLAEARSLADNRSRRRSRDESPSPSPSIPTGPRTVSRGSTSTVAHGSSTDKKSISSERDVGGSDSTMQSTYLYKLQELERRLVAEREGRVLDRAAARKRLEDGEKKNRELEAELDRNRYRRGI